MQAVASTWQVAAACAAGGWTGLDVAVSSIRALLLPAAARLIDRRGVELSIDPRQRGRR